MTNRFSGGRKYFNLKDIIKSYLIWVMSLSQHILRAGNLTPKGACTCDKCFQSILETEHIWYLGGCNWHFSNIYVVLGWCI